MFLICSGTSELLTYIQWCWPHRVMFWGICLRVSGGSTRERFTLLGHTVPGMLDPPQVLRWASVINHLSILSGENLPSVSQSFVKGLRWWVRVQKLWDQGELPHVHQHWSHTQVEICHGLVRNLWLWLCFIITPACMCTFLHYTFMIHVNTQMSGKKICISIYLFFPWQKQNFLSHTAIKSKTLLAWRDSKHVSWKIYGSLELNCAGLLLEKDRWGLSRDMFYRFDFRCMFSYWRNATCILL